MKTIIGGNETKGMPLIMIVITAVVAFGYIVLSRYENSLYSGKIDWHDLEGIENANQPILVNSYMSIPGEDPWMDKYTFRYVKVVNFIESNFFPIRIDLNNPTNVLFLQKYNVAGPTVLILQPQTYVEIGRIQGFYPPGKFLTEIKAVLRHKGE